MEKYVDVTVRVSFLREREVNGFSGGGGMKERLRKCAILDVQVSPYSLCPQLSLPTLQYEKKILMKALNIIYAMFS